jgi:hypothetical protein
MGDPQWSIFHFTNLSFLQGICWLFSGSVPPSSQGLCLPGSVKLVCHTEGWGIENNSNMALKMNKYPIEIRLQLLKMLTGCLEIAFLNVMGFESFNHVMNIYFFLHLFIIGRNWVMDFSTAAPVHVYFFIAPVSIVIWQCKTSYVWVDLQRQFFFQRIFICHHHLH